MDLISTGIPNLFFNSELLFFISIFAFFISFLYITDVKVIFSSSNIFSIMMGTFTLLTYSLYIQVYLIGSFFDKKMFQFFYNIHQNDFLLFIKTIVICLSVLIIIASILYLKNEKFIKSFEIYIILFLSIFSMILVISSSELVLLYISLEMQSISFYILASSKQNSIISIEAGLKYFLLGAVSSAFLLLGTALTYGSCGITKFFELNLYYSYGYIIFDSIKNFLPFLFVIIPFFFKLGAAPFHFWVPDVYEGSPTFVMLFFSTIPKFVILIVIYRLFIETFNFAESNWILILFITINLSVLIGSFAGLNQIKFKRLFAYSTITNVGFVLSCIAGQQIFNIASSVFYLIVYIFIVSVFFFLNIDLRYYSNFFKFKNIFEYGSLINSNQMLSSILTLFLFSLIGIPPLMGFFGKFFIFLSLLASEMLFLLFFLMSMSVVASFYYLRFVRILLFKKFLGFIFIKPLTELSCFFLTIISILNSIIFLDLSLIFSLFNRIIQTSVFFNVILKFS